jgi:outer membrane immunogenic protein
MGRAMRTLVIGAGLLTLLASPVSAQTERPALWDGVYLGIQAGRGVGQAMVSYPSGKDLRLETISHPASIQLGYNVRRGDWLYGPELMVTGSPNSGSASCLNAAFTCDVRLGGQAHFNGRFGYTFGRALLYGTTGISSSLIRYTAEYTGSNPANFGHKYDNQQHHLGWNAGFGFEYAVSAAWTAGLEYRHISFFDAPHKSTNNFNAPVADRIVQTHEETINARLNYNFNR